MQVVIAQMQGATLMLSDGLLNLWVSLSFVDLLLFSVC